MNLPVSSLRRSPTALPARDGADAEDLALHFQAGPALLSLLIGALLWEAAARTFHWSFFPPLSTVLRTLYSLIARGLILANLARSLGSLAIGYGLAVVVGISVGLLMGRYRLVQAALEPMVHAFLATPKIAFVPVVFALFGLSRATQVVVVFLNAVFIIAINAMAGIRGVSTASVEMARSFGASPARVFWRVLLPGSMPLTMGGLRLGMGQAVKGMITGEMWIAYFGLGALLRTYGGRFDSAGVFAVLLVVVVVALLCTAVVEAVERRLTAWTGG